jgi:hypothetical protein
LWDDLGRPLPETRARKSCNAWRTFRRDCDLSGKGQFSIGPHPGTFLDSTSQRMNMSVDVEWPHPKAGRARRPESRPAGAAAALHHAEGADDQPVAAGYATSWEHIQDELGRLDLRIAAALEEDIPTRQRLLDAVAARSSDIEARRIASQVAGAPLALPHLARLFRLGPFEAQCLLACFAIEVDAKYEKHYALLQQGAGTAQPTPALLLRLLCSQPGEWRAARQAFASSAPLFSYRLLQAAAAGDEASPRSLARALRIDPRIADHLLGLPGLDDRVASVARLLPGGPAAAVPAASAADTVHRMAAFIRQHLAGGPAPEGLVFQLHGPDAAAQRAAVQSICGELALQLVLADAGKAPGDLPWLVGREAVLLPAALCIESTDVWIEGDKSEAQRESWFAAIRHFSQLTFLLGRSRWFPGTLRDGLTCIDVEFPGLSVQDRGALWEAGLAAHKLPPVVAPGVLAGHFRFNAEQIRRALGTAGTLAYWRDPVARAVTADDVFEACRMQVSMKPSGLARLAVPVNRWNQLVLPPDPLRQLRELCNQARHRHIVYGEWGFERRLSMGNGLNALFTGPPGTGKGMAAEALAAELQADLFKVDLSQTVSKYIGETEKHLERLFSEAEAGNAILFFDEADALFGKRSQAKDAHDRYANIETGYLLQRMEQHQGIVILATNLRHHLDEAFCRRMHFVVEFPFPDEACRARLWEGLFPPDVPRAEVIDFGFLARQFKLAGGNIRNIGVCAAFLAAAEGSGLTMRHLMLATRREYQKLGWPCNANDFGAYHGMLKELDG